MADPEKEKKPEKTTAETSLERQLKSVGEEYKQAVQKDIEAKITRKVTAGVWGQKASDIVGRMKGEAASDIGKITQKALERLSQKKLKEEEVVKATRDALQKYRETVLALLGPEEIDTYEKLDLFQRNALELFKKYDWDFLFEEAILKAPEKLKDYSKKHPLEFVLLKKIERREKLEVQDYQKIIALISPFLEKFGQIDLLKDSGKIPDLLKETEKTGILTVVHYLNASQRFQLLETMIKIKHPSFKEAVEGFTASNFISPLQGQDLMKSAFSKKLIAEKDIIEFSKKLKTGVFEKTQKAVRDFREAGVRFLKTRFKKGAAEFLNMKYLLLYEIGYHWLLFVLLGNVLVNIKRPLSLLKNPWFWGAIAGSGYLVEEVTGGAGKGQISSMLGSKRSKEQEIYRQNLENLINFWARNRGLTKFFLANLEKIHQIQSPKYEKEKAPAKHLPLTEEELKKAKLELPQDLFGTEDKAKLNADFLAQLYFLVRCRLDADSPVAIKNLLKKEILEKQGLPEKDFPS